MCSLIADVSEIEPYAKTLMKYLKNVLVDSNPDVRTVAARAIGSLYSGLGEVHFEGLVEWMLDTLKSETTSVQRSGAAQGLSQVLYTQGIKKLQEVMPEIIDGAKHKKPTVREGYMSLFVYLPQCFEERFVSFLPQVMPVVLEGLDDEISAVREVAMRAGEVMITNLN